MNNKEDLKKSKLELNKILESYGINTKILYFNEVAKLRVITSLAVYRNGNKTVYYTKESNEYEEYIEEAQLVDFIEWYGDNTFIITKLDEEIGIKTSEYTSVVKNIPICNVDLTKLNPDLIIKLFSKYGRDTLTVLNKTVDTIMNKVLISITDIDKTNFALSGNNRVNVVNYTENKGKRNERTIIKPSEVKLYDIGYNKEEIGLSNFYLLAKVIVYNVKLKTYVVDLEIREGK